MFGHEPLIGGSGSRVAVISNSITANIAQYTEYMRHDSTNMVATDLLKREIVHYVKKAFG